LTPPYQIFPSSQELTSHIAEEIEQQSNRINASAATLNIALSGGSTPKMLFQKLAQQPYREKINWESLHLYWGDERCVPFDHLDSNYGMTKTHLLDKIKIPKGNIHFIDGNNEPNSEAEKYGKKIMSLVPQKNNILKSSIIE